MKERTLGNSKRPEEAQKTVINSKNFKADQELGK